VLAEEAYKAKAKATLLFVVENLGDCTVDEISRIFEETLRFLHQGLSKIPLEEIDLVKSYVRDRLQ